MEGISATGIKTLRVLKKPHEYRSDNDRYYYDHYLLICLLNGKIEEFFLGDIDHLHGLTGHFIEQYKLEGAGE